MQGLNTTLNLVNVSVPSSLQAATFWKLYERKHETGSEPSLSIRRTYEAGSDEAKEAMAEESVQLVV